MAGTIPARLLQKGLERLEVTLPQGACNTERVGDRKRAAAGMHRSQFGENSMLARIPEELRHWFYGEERFYQARPAWPEGTEPETELPWLEARAGGPFFELRQYRCHPGQRENWVRFMDEVIIPFQVARGMVIAGTFVSPEEDDLYVWVRRFESEAERERQYDAVYRSPTWRDEIAPRIPEMMDRERMKVIRLAATKSSVIR